MKLPRIITHKNMGPILEAMLQEPYFQPGKSAPWNKNDWFWQMVDLEVPTGEVCENGLKTTAIMGHSHLGRSQPITGKEGFSAQGLEGKVVIRKPLFNALMNLRDLIPAHRGRIVRKAGAA